MGVYYKRLTRSRGNDMSISFPNQKSHHDHHNYNYEGVFLEDDTSSIEKKRSALSSMLDLYCGVSGTCGSNTSFFCLSFLFLPFYSYHLQRTLFLWFYVNHTIVAPFYPFATSI